MPTLFVAIIKDGRIALVNGTQPQRRKVILLVSPELFRCGHRL